MRLPVERGLSVAALVFLAGCGGGADRAALAPALPTSGPGADYPVVLGPPFTIDGVTYTPVDRLNYDEVGYAVAGSEGGEDVSLAHRTLPLPSYVEITALDSGRTILVRAERRGPMQGSALIELSPGAVAQLGINPSNPAPVRVRRVNPPEIERAALRRGERAPARMDTPRSLLGVLMRRLDPIQATDSEPPSPQTAHESAETAAAPVHEAGKEQTSPSSPSKEASVVQVGAFAVKANAEATAAKLGASLEKSGMYWLVRLGPYATRSDLAEALAKARAAGYSDARIQRVD
jgi:rare lipoprotein A